MKTILLVFFVIAGNFQMKSQSPSMVSVEMQYRIEPVEHFENGSLFFLSKINDASITDLYSSLLNISANRILKLTANGDSVLNYNPLFIYQRFATSNAIEYCRNYKSEDFMANSGGLIPDSWWMKYQMDCFKKKGVDAISNDLIVLQNKKVVCSVDTSLIERKGKFVPVLNYVYLEPEKISPFFMESWNFDFAKGVFEKNVHYYGFYNPKLRDGELIGYIPVMGLDNIRHSNVISSKSIIRKNVICDIAIHWPEQILANDTSKQNVAGVDAVSFLSIADGNIPEVDRAKFLASIFYFAINNPGNVFPENNNIIDTLHPFPTPNSVVGLFYSMDTVFAENPLKPGVFDVVAPIRYDVQLNDVYALRFYEDWYYDQNDFTIKKVVRGLGIILLKQDPFTGEPFLKDAGIFIKMN